MYLLNNEYTYFDNPWPHIVIDNALPADVADYMLTNFPAVGSSHKEQKQDRFVGYPEDPIFKEFIAINEERKEELYSTLNTIFKQPEQPLYNARCSFKCIPAHDGFKVVKPWHTDKADKKYMILLYLGGGPGGWYEMGNPVTKQLKKYDFVHNRLLIYNNSDISFHRFFASTVPRRTISFAAKFVDPNARNYTGIFNHLNMKDNLW